MKKKGKSGVLEGDLTPMIDMTFQLIAFFMVLINFTQAEQNEHVKLPESTLAKPPEAALEFPITLQMGAGGEVYYDGQALSVAAMNPYLQRELNILRGRGKNASDATIIIRAHEDARTGKVQQMIQKCKDNGFEKFALRAKERVLDQGVREF